MGVTLLLILIILLSVNFIIDFQWFNEVKYLDVFKTKILTILIFASCIFLIYFMVFFIYFKGLKKISLKIIGEKYEKIYNRLSLVINGLTSLFLALITAVNSWKSILTFFYAEPFAAKDPVFNLDISFYIFKLPLIKSVYQSLFAAFIIIILITLIFYIVINIGIKEEVSKTINFTKRGANFFHFAGKSFAGVISAILILFSGRFIIKALELVYSSRGVAYGASYTDIKVTLPFYIVIAIVAIIVGVLAYIFIIKRKKKALFISLGILVAFIILEIIVSVFMEQVIVKSNQMEFEKPYLEYNIAATKKAYNIDNIEEKSFEPNNELKLEDLEKNKDILDNLKVNSAEPILNFYQQVQLIKNYYAFNDVDTDRYDINGDYTQVFVAAREIETNDMSVWQNKHLRYTHGYGVTMSKVNEVTKEGQPSFVMKDIPTVNSSNILVENPRIYFGESTNGYSIINTDVVEFDYPDGETENSFKYDGDAGIKMNFFNRVLFSLYEKQPKILFSGSINSNSKILINKNIKDRASKIAPFLRYDEDAYMVINNGKLLWVIDAYTVSDKYPFSEPYDGINYLRNSVKVTVDAYTGEVNFYIIDESDPIIKTYDKIFIELFKSKDELPEGIFEHFRYPQEIFRLQSKVLAKYHIDDSIKLFTQEDLWDVSSDILSPVKEGEDDKIPVEPLYLMTRLPGEKDSEMMLFEYFNMKGKQNMVSLLGARMDGHNYGKLIMYKFPQQKAIYSPYLFKNRMLQDPEISKEISLWAGKGSSVIYGDIVIVPIEKSLLYMNTIYLKAESNQSMPEMKRVILSNGDEIVIEENVEKALANLFDYNQVDEGNVTEDESDEKSPKSIKEASILYEKAIEAQRNGDWAAYGDYINKLGEMINELAKE